jgi:hypothetical protein
MVQFYIDRETSEKLLSPTGSPLLSSTDVRNIFKLVSEEMWISETRILDVNTVREVVDVAQSESLISEEAAAIVRERAPSMVFFKSSVYDKRVQFEHEIFFAYFLGISLAEAVMGSAANLQSMLFRSALPEGTAQFATQRLIEAGEEAQSVLTRVSDACVIDQLRSMQVRENAGAIGAAAINLAASGTADHRVVQIKSINNMSFAGAQFADLTIFGAHFSKVVFHRADISQLKLNGCSGEDVTFYDIKVDPKITQLDITGVRQIEDVFGIKVSEPNGTLYSIYDVSAVADILKKCGLPSASTLPNPAVDESVVELLGKVLRKFERSSLFWQTDAANIALVANPKWHGLQGALLDAQIIEYDTVGPHKGTTRLALRRRFLPEQIMAGQIPGHSDIQAVIEFWKLLKARFPPA